MSNKVRQPTFLPRTGSDTTHTLQWHREQDTTAKGTLGGIHGDGIQGGRCVLGAVTGCLGASSATMEGPSEGPVKERWDMENISAAFSHLEANYRTSLSERDHKAAEKVKEAGVNISPSHEKKEHIGE